MGCVKWQKLKKSSHTKSLIPEEALLYIGYPGEVTIQSNGDALRIHNGVNPGGFDLSNDNTLTIEQIKELLDFVYLPITYEGTPNHFYKTLVISDSGTSKKVKSKEFINNIYVNRYEDDENSETWGSFKIGEDYVPGSGVKFFIDWAPMGNSSGQVIWGI